MFFNNHIYCFVMFFYKHLNFKWSFGLNAAWIETATTARLSLLALSAIIYYSVSGGPYGAEVWTRGETRVNTSRE